MSIFFTWQLKKNISWKLNEIKIVSEETFYVKRRIRVHDLYSSAVKQSSFIALRATRNARHVILDAG